MLHNLRAQEGTLGQPGQSFHGLTLGRARAIPTAQTQDLLSNIIVISDRLEGCNLTSLQKEHVLSVRWPCPIDCSKGEEMLAASQAMTE